MQQQNGDELPLHVEKRTEEQHVQRQERLVYDPESVGRIKEVELEREQAKRRRRQRVFRQLPGTEEEQHQSKFGEFFRILAMTSS